MSINMPTSIARANRELPLSFDFLENTFAGYWALVPLAHSLYRTAEVKHLRQARLLRPLLDVGCGSGEFAELALRVEVDVGLDLSMRRLSRCRRRPIYQHLCLGNACRMPFSDEDFQTVLAVSVLEHLPQPQHALAEVCRVLRPGGHLVGTVTLLDMREQLFYPQLLRRLCLRPLARWYVRLHDRLFEHRCLLTQQQWEEKFAASGLELLVCRKIVVPRLTRYWDMLLPFALPYRMLPRWLSSLLCRPPGVRTLVRKCLLPLCYAEESEGSSLFFAARKPEESPCIVPQPTAMPLSRC